MDPFSITAGTLGISETSLAAIKTLRETIYGFQNAPDDVHTIRTVLEELEKSLDTLRNLGIADQETSEECKAALTQTHMVEAVNNCGAACEAFKERLKQWTSHSTEDKLSKRDSVKVVWNKSAIADFKTKVQTWQGVVHLAVSTTEV